MQNKIKILYISPSYFTDYGGAENQITKILNFFKDSKYFKTFEIDLKGRENKNFKYFPNFLYKLEYIRKRINNFYLIKIFFQILSKKYALVHSHNFNAPAILLGITSQFLKTPMLVKITLHGKGSKINDIIKSKIRSFFFKYFYRNIYFHVAVPELVEDLKGLGIKKNKILHLPNGVKTNNFEKAQFKKKQFCYTGRLIRRKCIYELVKIFHKANLSNSILNIYGEGPESSKIDEYLKHNDIKNIFLKGYYKFSEEKIIEISKSNNVYISYSHSEAMSNSSMEAIANGLLSVLRKIPPNEYITPPNDNFLVDDELSLINVIKKIDQMSNDEINESMEIQKDYLKKFDISETSENFFETYLKLINA